MTGRIELAAELGARTIAFPAISTGAYGYTLELAAPTVIAATREALAAHPEVEEARPRRTRLPERS